MSPGTRSAPSTVTRRPSRSTAARGASIRRIAAIAASALPSWMKADHRIGQHHRQDHPGIDPVLQGARHHGRAKKHVDQHIVELREEPQQRPARPRLGQPVRPVLLKPPSSLYGGQSLGTCLQRGKAGVGWSGVGIGHRHLWIITPVLFQCPPKLWINECLD